jgi:hypothetical protein
MNNNVVTIIPNFITQEECSTLNTWVKMAVTNKWLDLGITTGGETGYSGRLTTRLYANRFDSYPDLAYTIQDRIRKQLNLLDTPISIKGGGKHGIVVSNTLPGGDVYHHNDPLEFNDCHVLRCNIITQMADSGAILEVNNNIIQVSQGDLHCYLASKYKHSVTKVTGKHSRILWMFGFQITDTEWENKC